MISIDNLKMTSIPYSLIIQTDSGANLFSQSGGMPPFTLQSFALLQAFSQTAQENLSSTPQLYGLGNPLVLTTKSALLSFTTLTFEGDNQLMIFLATKNLHSMTSERAIQWLQRVLYHVRNMLIMMIGVKEMEGDIGRGQLEGMRKKLKQEFGGWVAGMFKVDNENGALSMESVHSMEKVEYVKDIGLKAIASKVQQQFGIQHIAMKDSQGRYMYASKQWMSIHEADRYLLTQISQLTQASSGQANDMPVYLTHTALNDDFLSIGLARYRFISVVLKSGHRLEVIADHTLKAEEFFQYISANETALVAKEDQKSILDQDFVSQPIKEALKVKLLHFMLLDHHNHLSHTFPSKHSLLASQLLLKLPIPKESTIQVQYITVELSTDQIVQLYRLKEANLEMLVVLEGNVLSGIQSVLNQLFKVVVGEMYQGLGESDQLPHNLLL
ncbi:hypothetical protein FGO68_gene5392 [Halteria grandinella]|uniref:Uncharacterized protein n=1 Tax=Halteria grandinella TaxID=5974 RepID=A0A8J8T1Q2_HALGN|nr:hypothetical protein FGO68_gene5392 [Halteria grandinella]